MGKLMGEYKTLRKPDRQALLKSSVKIGGTMFAAAIVLRFMDMGFSALLALLLK